MLLKRRKAFVLGYTVGICRVYSNMLAIVPRVNQICNIGAGVDSTHAQNVKTTKYIKYKNMLFMPTHEFDFPLKHPDFCACDMDYHNLVYRCVSGNAIKCTLRKSSVGLVGEINADK